MRSKYGEGHERFYFETISGSNTIVDDLGLFDFHSSSRLATTFPKLKDLNILAISEHFNIYNGSWCQREQVQLLP